MRVSFPWSFHISIKVSATRDLWMFVPRTSNLRFVGVSPLCSRFHLVKGGRAMAPKRQPIGAKGSQVSGDQSSHPGNQSFRKKTDRSETPNTGLQGAQEKLIPSRKKTMSTAEKLDLLDEEKKAKAKPVTNARSN